MDFMLFVFFLIHVYGRAELQSVPVNQAVTVGDNIQLNCSVNPDSESTFFSWEFAHSQSSIAYPICSQTFGCNRSRTSFQPDQPSSHSLNLVSESVQLTDAGLYVCVAIVKSAKTGSARIFRSSAHLTVIENPTCGRETGVGNIWCRVPFRGNWPPSIYWKSPGNFISKAKIDEGIAEVLSTLPSNSGDCRDIVCLVSFSDYKGNISASANNTPPFERSCSIAAGISGEPNGEKCLKLPGNQALTLGQSAVFACRVISDQSATYWTFRQPNSNSSEFISRKDDSAKPLLDGYTIQSDVNFVNLSISSVNRNAAGVYFCNIDGHLPRSAHLIVIEERPQCGVEEAKSNISGTVYHLWCSVDFSGSWAPSMEWRLDSVDGHLMSGVDNYTVNNKMTTCRLTIIGETAKKDSKYVCRTFFSPKYGLSVSTVSDNIPNYVHTWISPVINPSGEVKSMTLIVTFVLILILIFVSLIVYHVFFKRIISKSHQESDGDDDQQQEAEYETVGEPGEATDNEQPPLTPPPTEDEIQLTLDVMFADPIYYSALSIREQTRPHSYNKLPSSQPNPLASTNPNNQPVDEATSTRPTTATPVDEINHYVNCIQDDN